MKAIFIAAAFWCFSAFGKAGIELPRHEPNDSMVVNAEGRYTLQYSPFYRSAIWVAYKLTLADTQGSAGRSSSFTIDRELQRRGYTVAQNHDYAKSGYDKGHLLPSADRQATVSENRATFILSNCSPQIPALNRGVWKSLEEGMRDRAAQFDTIYIIIGCPLHPCLPRLGKDSIAIPELFFKAALGRRGDSYTPMCYVFPNSAPLDKEPERYRVTLDSLERLSGLRLFDAVREIIN